MRELTLKELQDFCLNILDDVHHFCVSNNIRYSLAYGTLIGAIRHKGFIPWDDDVDIIMPRPDYERFCKTYKSVKYKVSSYEVDSDCRMTYARVFDDNRTIVKSYLPWNKKEHGAWIDLFPLDGAEDNYEEYKGRVSAISQVFDKLQFRRSILANVSFRFNFITNAKIIIKKILCFNTNFNQLIETIIGLSKRIEYGKTHHWGMTVFIDSYGIKDYHESILFEDVVDVEFEGHLFKSLIGYDAYLRNMYGDYMLLPPEDERVARQTYLHVYWKE